MGYKPRILTGMQRRSPVLLTSLLRGAAEVTPWAAQIRWDSTGVPSHWPSMTTMEKKPWDLSRFWMLGFGTGVIPSSSSGLVFGNHILHNAYMIVSISMGSGLVCFVVGGGRPKHRRTGHCEIASSEELKRGWLGNCGFSLGTKHAGWKETVGTSLRKASLGGSEHALSTDRKLCATSLAREGATLKCRAVGTSFSGQIPSILCDCPEKPCVQDWSNGFQTLGDGTCTGKSSQLESFFHLARASSSACSKANQTRTEMHGMVWPIFSLGSNLGISFLQSTAAHTSARFKKRCAVCRLAFGLSSGPPCLVINPWYSMTNHHGVLCDGYGL